MFSKFLYDEVTNCRQNPDLNKELVLHIESYLCVFSPHDSFFRLVSEVKKYLLALKTVALFLDDSEHISLTKAHLQNFERAHEIASPNRVSALVDVAVQPGFLDDRRSKRDLRQNLLTSTEKLERFAVAGLQPYYEPLNILLSGVSNPISADHPAIERISNSVLNIYFQNSVLWEREKSSRFLPVVSLCYNVPLVYLGAMFRNYFKQPNARGFYVCTQKVEKRSR